jgi:hypothetical protein
MTFTRGDLADILLRDGESLVLLPHRCMRLSAVPTAIVTILERPKSREEIESRLEDVFGAAPQGRLDAIIEELSQAGVIRATVVDASDT